MRDYRRRIEKLEKALGSPDVTPVQRAPVNTSELRRAPKTMPDGWIGRIEWPDGRVTYRFPVEGMRANDV